MSVTNRNTLKRDKNHSLINFGKPKELIISKVLGKLTETISAGCITFKLDNGKSIECDSGRHGQIRRFCRDGRCLCRFVFR